uniref:Uncharacterized protein n=1 Tax=Lygus hesperus TaxID=30085 RepID=A0A0A9X5G1_LYGHE
MFATPAVSCTTPATVASPVAIQGCGCWDLCYPASHSPTGVPNHPAVLCSTTAQVESMHRSAGKPVPSPQPRSPVWTPELCTPAQSTQPAPHSSSRTIPRTTGEAGELAPLKMIL